MAWIKSHADLENHPKTLLLQRSLNGSLNETLGILHRFWWWCLRYCEDGQLERYGLDMIGTAIGINAQLLVDAGWIDTTPRLQIHDWWSHTGPYWRTKYKQTPSKYLAISKFYGRFKHRVVEPSSDRSKNRQDLIRLHKTYLETKTKASSSVTLNDKVTTDGASTAILAASSLPATTPDNDQSASKPLTPQAQFVEDFKATYEGMTHQPFQATRPHFAIAAALLKAHGAEAAVEKVRILGTLCRDRSAWFTQDGWADFTIEKLSKHWNAILERRTDDLKRAQFDATMRERREKNAATDAVIEQYRKTTGRG